MINWKPGVNGSLLKLVLNTLCEGVDPIYDLTGSWYRLIKNQGIN
jgi:hypothetical protein